MTTDFDSDLDEPLVELEQLFPCIDLVWLVSCLTSNGAEGARHGNGDGPQKAETQPLEQCPLDSRAADIVACSMAPIDWLGDPHPRGKDSPRETLTTAEELEEVFA